LILRAAGHELRETEAATVFHPVADLAPPHLSAQRWIDPSSGVPVLRETRLGPEPATPSALNVTGIARKKCTGGIVTGADIKANAASLLSGSGVAEAGIVVPSATRDGFEPGPFNCAWPLGFKLRPIVLQSGGFVPPHTRAESEIVFVLEGTVEIGWAEGAIMLGAGDTLSVPVGLERAVREYDAQLFVVRGSEDPAMPIFSSMPPHA
jgi:mannose-6-phosphate isomerase-like protein (cupin superfamily)